MQIHSQYWAEQLHHFDDVYVVTLSMLVLNSRDQHKMVTEFYRNLEIFHR